MFLAKTVDVGTDAVEYMSRSFKLLFMASSEFGRVGKWPVQPYRHTRENWTTLGLGFATNRDHKLEHLAGFPDIEHGLRIILGDIYSDFLQNFDCERIELAGLKPCAVCFEEFSAQFVHKRSGNLAARAVMYTDEEDFLFHDLKVVESNES
jgi:hypothetical protein